MNGLQQLAWPPDGTQAPLGGVLVRFQNAIALMPNMANRNCVRHTQTCRLLACVADASARALVAGSSKR